ncbi:hypothetical protein [Calderihabitans maritimus]|uniref:Uncharacterized protein n=1 Tax=Calderihabitans maritimus TaxID=1246530 RepID=A0A1Z5HQ60_9FIRM|nr:hypothetical protein [Calderihabitans maritimus]GAW91663.1 hypothetical protein KKC1_08240 [Calderihabitans maritimus]
MFIIAGLLAAVLGWAANNALFQLQGKKAVEIFIPVIEETLKSSIAWLLGASLVLTHAVFGAVEALYDLHAGRTGNRVAAVGSFLAHVLFGAITWMAKEKTGYLLVGIFAAVFVHLLWNGGVFRLTS